MLEKLFVVLWAAAQKNAWDPRYSILFNSLGQGMSQSLKAFSALHSNQEPVGTTCFSEGCKGCGEELETGNDIPIAYAV